jgi:hypothetical protein
MMKKDNPTSMIGRLHLRSRTIPKQTIAAPTKPNTQPMRLIKVIMIANYTKNQLLQVVSIIRMAVLYSTKRLDSSFVSFSTISEMIGCNYAG